MARYLLAAIWVCLGTWAMARPVSVTLMTTPAGARVYDPQMQYLGQTGLPLELDFTHYSPSGVRLTLQADGYQSQTVELHSEDVEGGRFPQSGTISLIRRGGSAPWPALVVVLTALVGGLAWKSRTGSELPSPEGPVQVRRAGPYCLSAVLGRGGMATVYAAESPTGEPAAVKLLLNDPDGPHLDVRRVKREIKITATLSHRGIVRLLDYGETESGYYIAMELVDGQTLRDRMDQGRVGLAQVRDWLQQLCLAVGYAHRQTVVHRDLKPENIMVTRSGLIKVMDFGLARSETSENLTQSGEVFGTVAYMAPEQVQGRSGASSDQYAVGLLAFELLTGGLPFQGMSDPMQILHWHLSGVRPAPSSLEPSLPRTLDAVVLRMLETIPERRYPSLEAAWVALDEALP